MTPTSIHYKSAGNVIEIVWPDDHVSLYATEYLRGWCPCAVCQGHFHTRYVFQKNDGPSLINAEPVGGYGVKFTWSDGHDAGIYTFRDLRALCPCNECKGEEVAADVNRGRV